MNTVYRRLRVVLALSTVCMASSLHAGVVETVSFPKLMGMVQTAPAFREAVLEQISLFSSLSNHGSLPSLSSNLADPVKASAERLVGALVAQPQAISQHQKELFAAFGEQSARRLEETSARMEKRVAAGDRLLISQLAGYRQKLDLNNAGSIQEFGAQLDTLFENSVSRPEGAPVEAVAASDPAQKKMPAPWTLKPSSKVELTANQALIKRALADPNYEVRREAADRGFVTEDPKDSRVQALLVTALADTDGVVRSRAALLFRRIPNSGSLALELLEKKGLVGHTADRQNAANQALTANQALIKRALADPNYAVRREAADRGFVTEDPKDLRVQALLFTALADKDGVVRSRAALLFRRIPNSGSLALELLEKTGLTR